MPLPREDVDATTPKFLRDKYAIVGVGETDYRRGSDKSTRALASIAVRNAMSPNCRGVIASASAPSLVRKVVTSGEARALLISAFSALTISAGNPAGPAMPHHVDAAQHADLAVAGREAGDVQQRIRRRDRH